MMLYPTTLVPMLGLQNLPKVRRELLTMRMMIMTTGFVAPAILVERPIVIIASTSIFFSKLSFVESLSSFIILPLQIKVRRP